MTPSPPTTSTADLSRSPVEPREASPALALLRTLAALPPSRTWSDNPVWDLPGAEPMFPTHVKVARFLLLWAVIEVDGVDFFLGWAESREALRLRANALAAMYARQQAEADRRLVQLRALAARSARPASQDLDE